MPSPEPTEKRTSTFSLPVLIPSLLVLGVVLLIGVVWPGTAERLLQVAQGRVTSHLGTFYILAVAIFTLFLVGVACSKFGRIRLGPDDARPEFNFVSWLAMLFAAGMGIGLMYFGVAEPMQHYLNPPIADPGTPDAARQALTLTFFHWGFHAWAIYGVVGLVLAYFGFRYNLPLTIRAGLYPLLRERVNGPLGHAVDVFALCATVFGIAVSLGYGVLQISAGLGALTGWPADSLGFQIGLIAFIIGLAGLSAASGLARGVRRLSELNLVLAIALLLFVLVAGPTRHLAGALSENLGNYFSNLIRLTFHTYTYDSPRNEGWFGGWTLLYWAWWISWSPFVGMFIARISRGRTVREFITGVLVVPATFNFIWMTIFGNTAIWLDTRAGGALAAVAGDTNSLLFHFLDLLPFASVTSGLAVLLVAVFFITSADSGAYVLDGIASRGREPSPVWQRLFWAVILGVMASVLLAAGGLGALQAMSLISALPFAAIMLILCGCLWKGMAADHTYFTNAPAPGASVWSGQQWKRRLEQILHQPTRADVGRFIQATVRPAFEQVAAELRTRGQVVNIEEGAEAGALALVMPQETLRNFVYGVRCVERLVPEFALRAAALPATSRERTFEPVTFFEDGRKGYDIQYLTTAEVIADVLNHYELYLRQVQSSHTHVLNTAPGHTSS